MHKEEVTKLLLADRMQMKGYIAEFGAYDDKMPLSDEVLDQILELYKNFSLLFRSTDEVKSLLYMTQLHKEFWGKHPLSKLTHDIDQQLEGECIYFDK